MPVREFSNLSLAARHIPDYSLEPDPNGGRRQVELPGFVEIGAVIEGVFKPLARLKAAGLFADIERAKGNAAQSEGQPASSDVQPQG